MKEYIAEPGGRYTYTDDILNLQELSLSITSIFSECSNFIISGCLIENSNISPGYVWINGKIRHFEGAKGISYPYYIYEKNSTDSTTYANDANKKGRFNYLCVGGTVVPTAPDSLTQQLPQYIELSKSYAPRFIDKFIGNYALLIDTPFQKQTVKKDLLFTGNVTVEKDIDAKTSLGVSNPQNGFSMKNLVYQNGDVSIGVYLNGIMLNEIIVCSGVGNEKDKGAVIFKKDGSEQGRIHNQGYQANNFIGRTFQTTLARLYDNSLNNIADNTDNGSININSKGYENGITKFRNLNVYDGKSMTEPLFQVEGKTSSVKINALLTTKSNGNAILLTNALYAKGDKKLLNTVSWTDKAMEVIGLIGYNSLDNYDFSLVNRIGNIIIQPSSYININGELWVNGTNIHTVYVTKDTFSTELGKKVTAVSGKQLSTEDFTKDYKKKLDGISTGSVGVNGDGFVTAKDINSALSKKMDKAQNLNDLEDKISARTNLDVYSKNESNITFLRISNNLQELINLSADEINGLTPEQASALKLKKQETVRNVIDAERKGIVDLKLAKASNLSDLADKAAARKNIQVYSTTEIDKLLEGKLSSGEGYKGVVFTQDHKTKLEAIKTGNFAGTDANNKPIAQVEGYVMTSYVVKELGKKANLLLDGLNDSQKATIATNINVYTKTQANDKFASVESLWQDYITYLVKQGKSTADALKLLRDKLEVMSKTDVSGNYLNKANYLSELNLTNVRDKRAVCTRLGAAYAEDYQSKLWDSGWLKMSNSGTGTDTSSLYIRQIGNVVCIQGTINTAKRDGTNWGGTVAVIPNTISPPKYSLRTSACTYNDSHNRNRGTTFTLAGGSRRIILWESGMYNAVVELNFTYMV